MNNYQKFLIVLDLDGTLLTDEKTILPKTKQYLKELEEQGHVVAMASGRPPRAIIPYYQELGLKGPLISYNGACVYDPKDPSFPSFDQYFSKESVLDFLSKFPEGVIMEAFAENQDTVFYLNKGTEFDTMFHNDGMILKYGKFEEILDSDVYAFVVQLKDRSYIKMLDETQLYDETLFLRHWYALEEVAEFGSYNRSKATGIEKLQQYYGIDRAHTIAFGDAENDVEMLSSAGVPFAMKNADPHLKAIAGNITLDDNNHEGIYLTLKEFFKVK